MLWLVLKLILAVVVFIVGVTIFGLLCVHWTKDASATDDMKERFLRRNDLK